MHSQRFDRSSENDRMGTAPAEVREHLNRGLTRSSGTSREGLAMDATRTFMHDTPRPVID